MPQPPSREEAIFKAAVELTSAEERSALLDRECAGDAALRASVESLLRAMEAAGEDFLGDPIGLAALDAGMAERTLLLDETVRLDHAAAPHRAAPVSLASEDYAVGGEIARGGMGSVLEAEDRKLGRKVAMKVMRLEASASEDARSRFVREATVLARLEHPNIVPIHELGWDTEDRPFYTMKLVQGRTLQAILNGLKAGDPDFVRDYTLDRLLTVFRKICDALSLAHSKGVIHRDLKPENVMVGEFGEVLVMDWGIAKLLNVECRMSNVEAGDSSFVIRHSEFTSLENASPGMTLSGTVMGTPQYMSPEQADGRVQDIDPQSDVFSLGAILYALLTLRPPVEADSLDAVLEKIRRGEIRPPTDFNPTTGTGGKGKSLEGAPVNPKKYQPLPHCPGGRVPAALSAVAMRALTVDKARRYPTVAALAADVEAYQGGFATTAQHAGLFTQLRLLVQRHRREFAIGFAAWFIITALAVWFVLNLRASERETRRQAEIAKANERTAEQNAHIAQANEQRAVTSEQEAVAEKENVRRALAKSALALAEAAYREADGPAMQSALDQVPADLRDANWSYLLEQSDTSIARIPYGGYSFRSVAAHPKLPGVFAISGDRPVVAIINARKGERLLEFPVALNARAGRSLRVTFSPDGERIAVGLAGADTEDTGIEVHSARDGSRLLGWKSPGVEKLKYSPDGRHLLHYSRTIGGASQSLILWDATDGRREWTYEKSGAYGVLRGDFTPDGRQVLAASTGNNPVLLNVGDGAKAREAGVRVGVLNAFAISPDGAAFLWGDGQGNVHCGDLKDGRLLFLTHVHSTAVDQLAFTPDGKRFVSMADVRDGRVSLVLSDARTGAPLQSLVGGSGFALDIAIHPLSGEMVVVGAASRVWDIGGTLPRWSLDTQRGDFALGGAAFSMTDDFFFGPSNPARTALLDLRDGTAKWRPTTANSSIPSLSADGQTVALLRAEAGKTFVQVARRADEKVSLLRDFPIPRGVRALRLNPSGDRVLVVFRGSRSPPSVHDATMGMEQVVLDTKTLAELNDAQWIAGGAQALSLATAKKPRGIGNSEERIIVWDATTGKQVRSVVHPTALDCLVVAPDGKSFAAAGADKLVHVFDTETLAERQTFRAHDGPITALAWHPSRPIVATGSADLTIKLWNLESGRRLETLRGPTAAPRVLNFSPSGQRLACASADRMVRIWEPQPLQNAILDAPAVDGWEDLLGKLKADEVKANGNGWTLSGGVLVSGEKELAAAPLPGSFARSSYVVRATVRRVGEAKGIAVILPVADQQVAFDLDSTPKRGFFTGLSMLDGKIVFEQSDTVRGQQVKDTEPHELKITVRPSARKVQIVATLDDQPLYEWSGALSALKMVTGWGSPAQPTIHLGASSADWVVSAVKVKRLEAGK